jgi:ankyrin repeat protein
MSLASGKPPPKMPWPEIGWGRRCFTMPPSWGDVAFARVLLSHHADVNAIDSAGRAPLHESVMDHNAAMIDLFINNGADIDLPDASGVTPLILTAGRRGDTPFAAATRILDRGAVLDPSHAVRM